MQERPGYSFTVTRRSGSPFWQARIFIEGEGGDDLPGRRFSTGVRVGERWRESKREAEKVADQRAAKLAAAFQGQQVEASSTSLKAVSERMLLQKTADNRRDRAVDGLAGNLDKHVLPYFGPGRDISTIRRSDLEAFKRHLRTLPRKGRRAGLEPVTTNNILSAIRQTLRYACEYEEILEAVPIVKNVETDKQGKGRALTKEQVSALINAVNPRETEAKEWLLFIANTGLRKSEALSIRWEWVDWTEMVIRIPAEYRKGGKPQLAPTPMNELVQSILSAREVRKKQPSLGRVWFQQKHDEARNAAAKRAGLGRVRGHDLRHTAGSLAHAAGAAATEARDLLGHSTLAMVSRYGHSYQDRLAAVAQSIQVGADAVPDSVTGQPGSRGGLRSTSVSGKKRSQRRHLKGSR